jgi:Mn2+/Fe2+ NRAMP family transporter
MITLLGGSCGGYITFSGAHRLLDAGYGGKDDVAHFRKSVLTGISVSGIVRILLFLCVLGVCTKGGAAAIEAVTNASNPAAEAFRQAAGELGYRLFGLALFAAGTTSVIGAAYTSVSFLKTLHPFIMKNERWFIVGFIAFSTLVMAILGGAKGMVILAGAVNGLILPISLACILLACRNKKIVGDYHHPVVLQVLGWVVVVLAAYLAVTTLPNIMNLFKM